MGRCTVILLVGWDLIESPRDEEVFKNCCNAVTVIYNQLSRFGI